MTFHLLKYVKQSHKGGPAGVMEEIRMKKERLHNKPYLKKATVADLNRELLAVVKGGRLESSGDWDSCYHCISDYPTECVNSRCDGNAVDTRAPNRRAA